jgi:hypothetical protein
MEQHVRSKKHLAKEKETPNKTEPVVIRKVATGRSHFVFGFVILFISLLFAVKEVPAQPEDDAGKCNTFEFSCLATHKHI